MTSRRLKSLLRVLISVPAVMAGRKEYLVLDRRTAPLNWFPVGEIAFQDLKQRPETREPHLPVFSTEIPLADGSVGVSVSARELACEYVSQMQVYCLDAAGVEVVLTIDRTASRTDQLHHASPVEPSAGHRG